MRDDLNAIKNVLLQNPSSSLYGSGFRSCFDSCYAALTDSMDMMEFFLLCSRIVGLSRCGHTSLSLPDDYARHTLAQRRSFPLKLYFQENRAYVLRNYSDNPSLVPGTEIISVNDIAMPVLIKSLLDMTTSDGYNLTYKYAKLHRKQYGLFPAFADFPARYCLTCVRPGVHTQERFTIDALRRDEITGHSAWRDHPNWDKSLDFSVIDSLSAALMCLRDFVAFSGKEYRKYLRASFETLRERNIQYLVIDLRGNDGGDPQHAGLLLSYLMDRPFTYFSPYALGYPSLKKPMSPTEPTFAGELFVLTDGGSFSTTGHLLSLIKYHRRGTLLGEESGGSYRCNGGYKEHMLPHSKMRLNSSRIIYATLVRGFENGRGIAPDIAVRPAIDDLISGRDAALDFTLALIAEKRGIP